MANRILFNNPPFSSASRANTIKLSVLFRYSLLMGFSVTTSFFTSQFFNSITHKNIQSFYSRDVQSTNKLIEPSKHKMGFNRIVVSCSNSEAFEFDERTSPNQVKKEIEQCYELIHRLGRGVVYLGSSRMGPSHPHYNQVFELGRDIANLLNCTTWSGAGPGLMDAATKGALEGGKPVGGFKISKEAGEWTATNFHPYLPSNTYLTCRFFSARKHGLVDCVVRNNSSDRTAVVALPGGIGTLDEMFEILALIQLQRIGSELQVPFLLMNYDSFYTKLLEFLDDCTKWGVVADGEVYSLWKTMMIFLRRTNILFLEKKLKS